MDPRPPRKPPPHVYWRRRIAALAVPLVLVAVVVVAASGSSGGSGGDDGPRHPWLPEKPTRLTIAASGDLLIHGPVAYQALSNGGGDRYDFRPMLSKVRGVVEDADIGICHLEVPLTSGTPQGYPVFAAPGDLAADIRWTGWDMCSNATNHTYDQLQDGIDYTIRRLDRAGVRHSGTSSKPGGTHAAFVKADGVKVALLAYTTRIPGMPTPSNDWALHIAEPKRILADARAARRAGAAVVIVSLHWGDEYVHEPSKLQRSLARTLTASPNVTAVIGQHVHVVQPIRRINGKPVVFGEGNLLSNQTAACCPAESQDGMIVLLDVRAGPNGARVKRVRYLPTWVQHPGFEVIPATGESRQRTIGYAGRQRPWLEPLPAG